MTGVNEDFYQPATQPGDIVEVEDEETGEMVKHIIYLDEFGNGTKTRPLTDEELEDLDNAPDTATAADTGSLLSAAVVHETCRTS